MNVDVDLRLNRHPLLADFLLQYPNCDEDAAERAFLVYQDLTEVRGWWSTEMKYSIQFERPYVLGQSKRFVQSQTILPVGIEESLSLQLVRQFFSCILVHEEPIKTVILAVNDLDSSVVYYKMTSGLQPPESPETTVAHQREKDASIVKKRQLVAACAKRAMEKYNQS